LSTWKRQLKGQNEYELSRKLLAGLYRFRNAFMAARDPFIYESQLSHDGNSIDNSSSPLMVYLNFFKIYESRLYRLDEERTSFESDLFEAEAVFGKKVVLLFHELFKLQADVVIATSDYLNLLKPETDQNYKNHIKTERPGFRDVLYDRSPSLYDAHEKDQVKIKFIDISKQIELCLYDAVNRN
jgi:hypothetical protein